MNIPNLPKPINPRFSCGPTRKPSGWSLNSINKQYLGRYHRSTDVRNYVEKQLKKIKEILKIPEDYELLLTPGSCTLAMEAVIWSLLGDRKITSIVFDYWGKTWFENLQKLNLDVDLRISLDGTMPNLSNIPEKNDVLFVWTGTSTGISVSNLDFLKQEHKGLVISDITSAAFIYDLPWRKLDVGVFSWQKALGSESQHGVIVISPKARKKVKNNNLPKILDISNHDYVINTPSLLTISDLEVCLDLYVNKGGLKNSLKICKENKKVLDDWELKNRYVRHFVKYKKFQAVSPVYLVFNEDFNHSRLFDFLCENEIAYDLENYRKAEPGIRVWTGPNILKNDLIALTNWLDWCFNKFIK